MSVEENKAVMRRLDEVFNEGNFDILPELITPDYVLHEINQDFKGAEGLKRLVNHLRNFSPDYHQATDSMVAEGDTVVVFYTITGTFTGKLFNITPTGKRYKLKEVTRACFRDRKQAEVWVYYDALTFYHQLGITPPAPQPI